MMSPFRPRLSAFLAILLFVAMSASLRSQTVTPDGKTKWWIKGNIQMSVTFGYYEQGIYASGTNSRASAQSTVVSVDEPVEYASAEITIFQLKINGAIVSNWTPAPFASPNASWAVMYDSARFSNTVQWEVRSVYKLRRMDGAIEYEELVHTVTLPVKNRATVFGRYDLDGPVDQQVTWNVDHYSWAYPQSEDWHSASYVRDRCSAMNYMLYQGQEQVMPGWSANQFLNSLEGSNVMYIATHGSQMSFWSDSNDYTFYTNLGPYPDSPGPSAEEYIRGDTEHDVPYFSILEYRGFQIGTGLPPLNVTVGGARNPPLQICLVMACDTGQNPLFASGTLYPYFNAFSPVQYENQAHVGFKQTIKLRRYGGLAEAFFGDLQAGGTVLSSSYAMWSYYAGAEGFMGDMDELIAVYGDDAARMRSVYTGTHQYQSLESWFRSI